MCFFSLVFRWAGPCPRSSKLWAGLMGRRSSLSSLLSVMLSFTVTSMVRDSWHDPRNSDCESIMVVWSLLCARWDSSTARSPDNQGLMSGGFNLLCFPFRLSILLLFYPFSKKVNRTLVLVLSWFHDNASSLTVFLSYWRWHTDNHTWAHRRLRFFLVDHQEIGATLEPVFLPRWPVLCQNTKYWFQTWLQTGPGYTLVEKGLFKPSSCGSWCTMPSWKKETKTIVSRLVCNHLS